MSGQISSETVTVADAVANARRLLRAYPEQAAAQAREIIRAEPGISEGHLLLANALRLLGRANDAKAAEMAGLEVSKSDPVLARVAQDLAAGEPVRAEQLLRRFLNDTPNDPEALRLLAGVAASAGNLDQAERLLRRALVIAPSFDAAQADLEKMVETLAAMPVATEDKPESPPEGSIEFEAMLKANAQAVTDQPNNPRIWLSYGHVLRMAGSQEESIAAYRRAIDLNASYGEAWSSLADLKTVAITEADVEQLEGAIASGNASEPDQIGMHFALGKALSDLGRYEESFRHYAAGNALKRKRVSYDEAVIEDHVQQSEQLFTAEFFSSRRHYGSPASDPIFIIGMPRSGSTLIEQILASHSAIEGTEELVYLGNLASILAGGARAGMQRSTLIEAVTSLSVEKAATYGAAYLAQARRHRHSRRPYFIDKMPRNWMYLPLIKLALPNAKIIDVRRNPLDCCWSNFQQLFVDAGEFSYDLAELGHYYRSYDRYISHFDRVLPGAILRVNYEDVIANPETQIRRLLGSLDLTFEPECLDFHSNPRAVKTASSEQVRSPINDRGIDSWKPFKPWLQPLINALGLDHPKSRPN